MEHDEPTNANTRKTMLDVVIKRVDWCIKGTMMATLLLGIAYAFALRTNVMVKLLFLASFFICIDTAAIGALLVAIREFKRGATIGTVFFFGSFGVVVLVASALIIKSLIPR